MEENKLEKNILVVGLSALTDGHAILYSNLNKMGYEAFILYQSVDRMPSPEIHIKSQRITRLPFLSFIQYLRLVIDFKPDLVEFYLHKFSFFGGLSEFFFILAAILLRKQINIVCTGREILGWKGHPWTKKVAVKFALKFSKSFLIKESYMFDFINKYRIAEPTKAHFIHNGVFEHYRASNFSGFKKEKVVLFFNSFKKWRNVDFLVKCASEIVKVRNDVLFLVVGARNSTEHCEANRFIEKLPIDLQWRIQIHSMHDSRQFYYGISDVLVLPADLVWLNNSVLEAMAMKLSVLIPDVDWVDKIIENNVNGYIYKHMDKYDFITKLNQLLDRNPNEATRIGVAARDTVMTKFSSWKRACLQYLFYEKILNDREIPEELFSTGDGYQVRSLEEIRIIAKRAGFLLPEELL